MTGRQKKRRPRPTWGEALRATGRVFSAMYEHHAFDAASAMAFHFFLSLVPLLVALGYVLGLVVRRKGVEAFMDPLLDAAPEMATEIVRRELERLAGTSAAPIAPLAVVGFLWIASSGTHGLLNVFEMVFLAKRRPWWKKRLIAVAWVAASLAATCGVAWAGLAATAEVARWEPAVQEEPHVAAAPSSHRELAPNAAGSAAVRGKPARKTSGLSPVKRRVARLVQTPLERWGLAVLLLALGVTGLAAFYRVSVEHPPGVERRAWPGAFVAMVAFLVVSWAFGAYVSELGSYALFYGGVAAVAVLLFWFYLSSLALLLGAEVNAQLEGVRTPPER